MTCIESNKEKEEAEEEEEEEEAGQFSHALLVALIRSGWRVKTRPCSSALTARILATALPYPEDATPFFGGVLGAVEVERRSRREVKSSC